MPILFTLIVTPLTFAAVTNSGGFRLTGPADALRSGIVAGALLAAALATPGVAHASLSQCLTDKMCVWGNNNYEWLIAAQLHGQGVLDVFNDAAGENDAADSWQNRSNAYQGCLYDHSDGTHSLLTMPKASKNPNVSWTDSDKTSSMRTNAGC